jgi:hypothetical protein
VKLSVCGLERWPAAFIAVITSVYRPGLSRLEAEIRRWKESLLMPARALKWSVPRVIGPAGGLSPVLPGLGDAPASDLTAAHSLGEGEGDARGLVQRQGEGGAYRGLACVSDTAASGVATRVGPSTIAKHSYLPSA